MDVTAKWLIDRIDNLRGEWKVNSPRDTVSNKNAESAKMSIRVLNKLFL